MLTSPGAPPTYHVKQLPTWMRKLPSHIRTGFDCTTSFSISERRAYRRAKKILPSEWCEKYRFITQGSMAGSLMKMEVTPHVVGQLDAADRPFVRCVVVCAGPQSAKSTMVDSYMGYRMDRAPGPALSVYPDKLTAEKNCRKRIHTMIDMSPRLRRLKTGNRDDITNLSVKLSTMEFLMGWSGSAISLSNESIMLLDLQEVDKYPESPNKKEAGTIEVAETRVIAFPNSYKIFITSTPTTENGPIWQALTVECEVIYDYYAKCPYCGKVQHMVFENIKWPKGDDGHSIDYRDIFREKLAWYECEECSAKWSDYDRNQAIQTKSWYERRSDGKRGLKLEEHLEKFRPAYIGFHQPSWISSRVSLSKVAADWLRIKDPRRDKNQQRKARKNFYNKHKAEAWLEREVTRTDDMLLALKDDRPAGVVPGKNKVAGLVFGADTQDDGFWYSIYAIGYGKVPERWLVQDGFVFSFDDLEAVLWENVYKDTDGNIYPVQFGLLDSMGHRTSEVYDFCDGFPGLILPSKGERTMATPYNYADVEFYPGTEKKKFPGNLKRVRVNTTHYKDKLDGLFRVKAADPGALRFHSEISEDFVFQMLAEERDENGVWVNDKNRANHQWDCGVLALVAADIKGIRFWPTPEEAQQVVKPIRQRKQKQKRQRW